MSDRKLTSYELARFMYHEQMKFRPSIQWLPWAKLPPDDRKLYIEVARSVMDLISADGGQGS